MSGLTPEEVSRIAELARLALTTDERELFRRQLADILTFFDQIAGVDTDRDPADLPRPARTDGVPRGQRPALAPARGGARERTRRRPRRRAVPRAEGDRMNLAEWSAGETRDAAAAGRISVTEICEAALSRVAALDGRLNAFRLLAEARARARAAELDRRRAELSHLPLFGVPIAVKDNISTRGLVTSASSRMLEHFVPPYDATVIARLDAAGAVVIGKTNCDEFAMGSSTENSAFGPTRNPWAEDRTPGGSSGGSAAAVAARMVPLALGSDTGGSIRQPASLCGMVGLKPSYGRVSRYGLLAFGSSLDQIGPLARTVDDAARLLQVIAGLDPADATSADLPVPSFSTLDGPIGAARIGVPRRLVEQGVDDEVRMAFDEALGELARLGAHARRCRAPARATRDPGLLPRRDGRGELEPRALRRGALHVSRAVCRRMPASRTCTTAPATRGSAPR